MKNTVRLVVGGLLCGAIIAVWAPAKSLQWHRLQAVQFISQATSEASWYADWLHHTEKCDWPEYRDWRQMTDNPQ